MRRGYVTRIRFADDPNIPEVPTGSCGAFWQTDYGPAYCDKGEGHEGQHRCYGSKGPILWTPLPVALPRRGQTQ